MRSRIRRRGTDDVGWGEGFRGRCPGRGTNDVSSSGVGKNKRSMLGMSVFSLLLKCHRYSSVGIEGVVVYMLIWRESERCVQTKQL